MNRIRLLALLSIVGLAVPLALSQDYYEGGDRPQRREQIPPAGFWPTEKMIDLFFDRITDDMSETYGFDEDQLYNTRELFKERFPGWLADNRAELMQVGNEYIEALLDGQAPSPEYVADWAQRAAPLFDEFVDLCEGVGEGMREYLTEEQQIVLDGQLAAFRVGVNYTSQRLGNWSAGGFDPETHWFGDRANRRRERERRKEMEEEMRLAELDARGELPPDAGAAAAAVAAGAQPPGHEKPNQPRRTAPASIAPKDEWTLYVENFIRRYQLNEEQQSQAYKFLRSAHKQRDNYLSRRGTRLANAQQRLEAAETPEQRATVQEVIGRLARPLGRMFQQLKEKLNRLPTRKQRLAAAQGKLKPGEKPASSEPTAGTPQPGAKRESPSSP